MVEKNIIAMLLAGGQGSRLHVLTEKVAKPAVPFGGKYRIIDFPLSNCVNSDIDTVGVLTQYQPLELNSYIGNGQPWDLDRNAGGVYVLPPYVKGKQGEWYSGTANAIYQNVGFVDQYSPKYVLILSGDHIYKMNYSKMLKRHIDMEADATIAVIEVPLQEAPRFGIMNTDSEGRVQSFEEKPKRPKSNLASMGIYIFSWDKLKSYLRADFEDKASTNDFGHDVIPAMLAAGEKLVTHPFSGYWKDVGTIESLWQANMDLLETPPALDLYDPTWRIFSRNPIRPPHYIADGASVRDSIVTEGCDVFGEVRHSVLFSGVVIEKGATVIDSIIMPGTIVRAGARVVKSILAERVEIGAGAGVGEPPMLSETMDLTLPENDGITLIGEDTYVEAGAHIPAGRIVKTERVMAERSVSAS